MDEPLYASFLSITGLTRPYRDLVLQAQVSTDMGGVGVRSGGASTIISASGCNLGLGVTSE